MLYSDVIFTVLGTGFLAILAASAILFYLSWNVSQHTVDGIFSLLEVLSGIYDQYIEPITQKVNGWFVAVKEWFGSVVENVKGKVKSSEKEEVSEDDTITSAQPSVVTV